jgi:hypothetical protein
MRQYTASNSSLLNGIGLFVGSKIDDECYSKDSFHLHVSQYLKSLTQLLQFPSMQLKLQNGTLRKHLANHLRISHYEFELKVIRVIYTGHIKQTCQPA